MKRMKRQPWYKDGLRFECTQCGDCCSGPSGSVQCTESEVEDMASALKVTKEEFLERYVHASSVEGVWELGEVPSDHGYDCVLLDRCEETGKTWCRAHKARPLQCRTWPFWPDNLRNKKSWEWAAKGCEGMGRGEIVPLHVIEREKDKTPEWIPLY